MQNLRKLVNNWGGQAAAPAKGEPPPPATPSPKAQPVTPPLPVQPKKAQVRRPRCPPDPKAAGGKSIRRYPPAPVNKEKKNPAKNPGTASVNQVEEDKESSEDEGSDTDALSHLPTDDESGGEDKDADNVNGDAGEQ